ncbi:MAG: class II aldolase [Candidatus Brocadiia bacterium]|nr:MAG: class II aldolase [Candidatus Brocadiia bacterium]
MNKALAELISISNSLGGAPSLVIGSAGNTSIKTPDGKFMYIKASGIALKDMTASSGWRRLQLDRAKAVLDDKSLTRLDMLERHEKVTLGILSACDDKFSEKNKPSIESCFHTILGRYVIHLHPAALLASACSEKGRSKLDRIFKYENIIPLWVPYAGHGYELACTIRKLSAAYGKKFARLPNIIILQNHGLLVTADTAGKAVGLIKRITRVCEMNFTKIKPVKPLLCPDKVITETCSIVRDALFRLTAKKFTIEYYMDGTIAAFLHIPNAHRVSSGLITPDEFLYANGPAVWLARTDKKYIHEKLKEEIKKRRMTPLAFIVKNTGLFIAHDKNKHRLIKDIVVSHLSIRAFAAGMGRVIRISKKQRELLYLTKG